MVTSLLITMFLAPVGCVKIYKLNKKQESEQHSNPLPLVTWERTGVPGDEAWLCREDGRYDLQSDAVQIMQEIGGGKRLRLHRLGRCHDMCLEESSHNGLQARER